ncbi:MAG: DUF883 family protein [Verrucomicrobiales bacterium]|nr:hypothetical protein [Verrucomicrobiota bacterium JB025]
MSDAFSTPDNLDPEDGFTSKPASTPSVSQAAQDLRAAATEKAREIAHTAEDKAAEIKGRATESAHQFRETAAQKASDLRAAAAEKSTHFRSTANEQWCDTRVKAREFQDTAEAYIKQNPTKSVISALGFGFLIGLIVRR